MWNTPMWLWCLAGVLCLPVLYLLWLGMMHFSHWLGRGLKPRDRVWAFVVICAVLGGVGGGAWSVLLDELRPCHDSGVPLAKCAMPIS